MSANRFDSVCIIGPVVADVTAGPVSPDVFSTGSHAISHTSLSFGGDALNEAVVLSRLGAPVELISKVGNDETGHRLLSFLADNRVETAGVITEEGLTTGINIVLFDKNGERFFLTNPNSSLRKLGLSDVQNAVSSLPFLRSSRTLFSFASIFVSPLFGIKEMKELFHSLKMQPGNVLCADFTKAKNGETLQDLYEILPYTDIVFPNEEEIALLTHESDPSKNAASLLKAGVSCVVIKCGKKGCLIRTENEEITIPSVSGITPLDTTGAGDNFVAGFLYGLYHGYPLPECGKLACATASCAVETIGANSGVVSLAEPARRAEQIIPVFSSVPVV